MKVHYNGIELSVFEMDELPRIVAVLMFFVDAVDDALTLCFIDAQDFSPLRKEVARSTKSKNEEEEEAYCDDE